MHDLGTLGGAWSRANWLNDADQVCDATNGMRDLETLVSGQTAYLWQASGINDAGQIAGSGYIGGGDSHAFIMTAVPSNARTLDLIGR